MQTNYCGENSGEKMCPLIVSSVSLPIEMLYFAISIFALSLGVYFIKKH